MAIIVAIVVIIVVVIVVRGVILAVGRVVVSAIVLIVGLVVVTISFNGVAGAVGVVFTRIVRRRTSLRRLFFLVECRLTIQSNFLTN